MMLATNTRRTLTSLAVASTIFGLAACGTDDPVGPGENTIAETAAATPTLSTLGTALEAAGLTSTLDGTGPFTVFAPVNDAFADLPNDVVTRLLDTGNREILEKLLTFHVVPGRVNTDDLNDGQTLTTVEGTQLTVSTTDGVRINGALVTTPDVDASNGVVHLIDGVMLGSLDIVDQATIRGFSSLVSAVGTANLADALRGGGTTGLTVFAPTNEAFAAIPGGAPTDAQTLAQVLQLHAVGATALSTSLTDGQTVASLLGPNLTIGITGTDITVTGPTNSASVVTADIVAKNGVIHVIDTVLLP